MFDINEELKKLPEKPGIYIMHGENDEIIYVGKAKILKRRVKQYFQNSKKHSQKIEYMVTHITRFEYIVTDTELEALVLESNLIKEHRPKYNTMLTDDKTYPFIKVTVKEKYPRVLFSRDSKHDSNKYFGPFTSAYAVKETIDLLCRLYKIRTCNRRLPQDIDKERPCLDYHIGKCSAPCASGMISEEDYRAQIDEVIKFLKGNYKPVLDSLTEKMKSQADAMEYEEAAKTRDLLDLVKQITQKQKITGDNNEDRDVIAYALKNGECVVSVFFIRSGKLLGRDHFRMDVADGDEGNVILSQFLKQYYGGTPYIPDIISLESDIDDKAVIEEWLSEIRKKKVVIITPKKGFHEKLVTMAKENAFLILEKDAERIKKEEAKTTGAMKEIADILGLNKISRAEAYDISNTNGIESVGSMVVFEDGRPKKNDYRRFKIKTVKGPDDYASMREVLTRRFGRAVTEQKSGDNKTSFSKLPDIILMDGGRGQVNIALKVLKELNLNIPVAGMVKDDTHSTRGLYYNNVEMPISTRSEGFKLITRIQDEAHRFAIEYHKKLRSKAQVNSVLDEIKGVGPARRKALMKYFMDIDKIRNADEDELLKVDGITVAVAKEIYNYFH
ncbi:MAG: excinuclease ABC subunit UvrC [Lachnospiraceae bacterium]|nr:excinuclease ABC subunit UvrC [Lachnospiraceae bacterium]